MKNDEEKIDEINDFIRIASMKFKIDIIHLQNFHSKEQSMTQNCLSFITVSFAFSFDGSILFNALPPRDPVEQTTREGDREAAATVNSLSIAIIPLLPKQPQNQDASVPDEKEWKIVKIIDKKWTENGYEYQMCWKKTWLLENELENAQQLLQQFETKYHAQRKNKQRRPVCINKNRWAMAIFNVRIDMRNDEFEIFEKKE